MSAVSAATADPGFRLDGGLLVEVDPSLAEYDEARGRQAHLALVDRLRTVPGVEAVSIGSRPPFSSMGDSRQVAPAGAADAQSRSVGAVFSSVGRDYARALGLPMLGGRDFSDAELTPGSSQPQGAAGALAEHGSAAVQLDQRPDPGHTRPRGQLGIERHFRHAQRIARGLERPLEQIVKVRPCMAPSPSMNGTSHDSGR